MKGSAQKMIIKTVIIAIIAAAIVFAVFRKIYKDYKKNKNLCGTDCCHCSTGSTCSPHKENHAK